MVTVIYRASRVHQPVTVAVVEEEPILRPELQGVREVLVAVVMEVTTPLTQPERLVPVVVEEVPILVLAALVVQE